MSFENTFKINQPPIIYENIDNEIIIVNLDKGDYFSIHDCGAIIWELIVQGCSGDEIISQITKHFPSEAPNIKQDIHTFIDELIIEGIITKQSEASTQNNITANKLQITTDKFEAPKLQKYTDMQNLLLLDPIHEVDNTGWPNKTNPSEIQ